MNSNYYQVFLLFQFNFSFAQLRLLQVGLEFSQQRHKFNIHSNLSPKGFFFECLTFYYVSPAQLYYPLFCYNIQVTDLK